MKCQQLSRHALPQILLATLLLVVAICGLGLVAAQFDSHDGHEGHDLDTQAYFGAGGLASDEGTCNSQADLSQVGCLEQCIVLHCVLPNPSVLALV